MECHFVPMVSCERIFKSESTMSRILVIDDDATLRGLIVKVLQRAAFEVLAASSGEAALQLIGSSSTNLVLCDVNMPGMNGYEVLERVRTLAATSAVPVILMTGDSGDNDVQHGMERGADDYLPKPFDMGVLLAAVGAVLERQNAIELAPESA